jgi:hypothetical protein
MSLVNPPDACRPRLRALIGFARREGWDVRSTDGRLTFVKAGLPPIFTPLPLETRDLLPPLSEDGNA